MRGGVGLRGCLGAPEQLRNARGSVQKEAQAPAQREFRISRGDSAARNPAPDHEAGLGQHEVGSLCSLPRLSRVRPGCGPRVCGALA